MRDVERTNTKFDTAGGGEMCERNSNISWTNGKNEKETWVALSYVLLGFESEITMPNKDFPGISKTVFTHVSNLHSLLSDWSKLREKGTKFCRGISALKLYECTDDYYPTQLKPLTEGLLEALNGMKSIVEGIEVINTQLQALSKLPPTDQPVILTWTSKEIADNVNKICISVKKEYRLKEVITENIAHCRDEMVFDVYISSWELDPYLENNPYLFAEVGLTGVT